MYDIGYYSTIAPYMQKSYWQALVDNVNTQRPGALYRVYIQCYDGGAGNNPRDWHLGGLPLHGGRLNYQNFSESINVMASWKAEQGVSGGFFWVYNDETWSLANYAMAVNRIYHVAENPVATFYSAVNFSGNAVSLPAGEYTMLQLMYYGIPDNRITSIKVSAGYKATVYTNDNFAGSQAIYTLDNPSLGSVVTSRISSLKIEQDGNALENSALPVTYSYDANQKVIRIESSVTEAYQIVDVSGAVRDHGMLQAGTNRIDVSRFSTGVYFIKVESQAAAVKIFLY
jgi:hypothetical protein